MKRGASAIAPWEPRSDVSRQVSDERRRTDGRGSPSIYLGVAAEDQDKQGRREMAGKTQTIEVKVDERLAAEIAGKAVHGWHATNYSNGKRRVYVTFEEVRTVGASA